MIQEIVRENLLAIVGAYRKATGKSLGALSKEFYGSGDFFAKLRANKVNISVKRLGVMLEAFRADWPKDAPWPPTRAILMTFREQK